MMKQFFLTLFALLSLVITLNSCQCPGDTMTPEPTEINSNITINSNFLLTFAEETLINYSNDIPSSSFYFLGENYSPTDVFVVRQAGIDLANLNGASVEVLNKIITLRLSLPSGLNYEAPADANGDNIFELATFIVTNVHGGSNVFNLWMAISNVPGDNDISITSNFILPLAENDTLTNNFSLDVRDFYRIDTINFDYDTNYVFVSPLSGVDVGNLGSGNSVMVTRNDKFNFAIDLVINNGLDFEMPNDMGDDNSYQLSAFLITNVHGGSNIFAVDLEVTNVAYLSLYSNQASYHVSIYTSNVIADLSLFISNSNEAGTISYEVTGIDASYFKIEGSTLKTSNNFGFRSIYENGGRYDVTIHYRPDNEGGGSLSVGVEMAEAEWNNINNAPAWTGPRVSAQMVVLLNNHLLFMEGGDSLFRVQSNIYLSENGGTDWVNISVSGAWNARIGFQSVVLNNNDILVLGGYDGTSDLNDILSSSDGGTNWNEITNQAPWSARNSFQSVVLSNNDILVLGGDDGTSYFNDVWLSSDGGTNWNEITNQAPWSVRNGFQSVVLSDNDILVLGGYDGTSFFDDVWLSSDGGTNWENIVSPAPWLKRRLFQAVVLENDDILVLGGQENAGAHDFDGNDIWLSTNGGTNWQDITPTGGHWSARNSFQAVFVPGRGTLVVGGFVDRSVWLREEYNRYID